MGKDKNGAFDDGSRECMLSFFLLGNYFALFGLARSTRAVKARLAGDPAAAESEARAAKKWARWGLIPSTILNAALVYGAVVFTIKYILPAVEEFAMSIRP